MTAALRGDVSSALWKKSEGIKSVRHTKACFFPSSLQPRNWKEKCGSVGHMPSGFGSGDWTRVRLPRQRGEGSSCVPRVGADPRVSAGLGIRAAPCRSPREGTGATSPKKDPRKRRSPAGPGLPGRAVPDPGLRAEARARLGAIRGGSRRLQPPTRRLSRHPSSPSSASSCFGGGSSPPPGAGNALPSSPSLQPQWGRGAVMLQGDPREPSGVSPSAGCRDLPARRRRPRRRLLGGGSRGVGGQGGRSAVGRGGRCRCPPPRG